MQVKSCHAFHWTVADLMLTKSAYVRSRYRSGDPCAGSDISCAVCRLGDRGLAQLKVGAVGEKSGLEVFWPRYRASASVSVAARLSHLGASRESLAGPWSRGRAALPGLSVVGFADPAGAIAALAWDDGLG